MAETTAPKPDGLAAALAAFQADLPAVVKSKTAKVATKTGRDYSYAYAGLPEISSVVLPLLGKVGLSFTAKPTLVDSKFVLHYKLQHERGERDEGFYPLPQSGTPQEYGSAITYARRYALCSVVGVAAEEDDDGHAAADTRSHSGDSWETAQPARPERQAEAPPEPVSQAQHRRMQALWRELGYVGDANRDNRLRITAKIVGMEELVTSASLTAKQAALVIEALEQKKADLEQKKADEAKRAEELAEKDGAP
jgi:hypothetical protein